MKQELLLFVDAIVVEDRSIVEFIDADWARWSAVIKAQNISLD